MKTLAGKIILVTGASRGGGRGVALVLGEAGATVYITGRSVRGNTTDDRPETIEETAALVTERGGVGIPVRCDHTQESEVSALFARIQAEQGRLDAVVSNAWGGYEGYDDTFDAPFWKQNMERLDRMYHAGLRAHILTSRHAAALMFPQQAGIIIHTTTAMPGTYHSGLLYDVMKHAINRMSSDMAVDFKPYGITSIALAPGWMRTEKMVLRDEDVPKTESPEFLGRAARALLSDPEVARYSGQLVEAADLGRVYGFTDIDGRQIQPFREHFPELFS